jgi:hypothetical protein
MHWRKKFTFVHFVFSLGLAAFCLFLAMRHEGPMILFFVFLGLACFSAYRFFYFSDDWFRTTNQRQAIWARRYPRLQIALDISGLAAWALWALSIAGIVHWHR